MVYVVLSGLVPTSVFALLCAPVCRPVTQTGSCKDRGRLPLMAGNGQKLEDTDVESAVGSWFIDTVPLMVPVPGIHKDQWLERQDLGRVPITQASERPPDLSKFPQLITSSSPQPSPRFTGRSGWVGFDCSCEVSSHAV